MIKSHDLHKYIFGRCCSSLCATMYAFCRPSNDAASRNVFEKTAFNVTAGHGANFGATSRSSDQQEVSCSSH